MSGNINKQTPKTSSKRHKITMTLCSISIGIGYLSGYAWALESLRGGIDTNKTNDNVNTYQVQETKAIEKNYRQQPPLVPHKTDKYQINLKVNQCLRCHDWPYNTQFSAPKISETHFVNSDGKTTDKVAPNRWFCVQCHVPQENAKELIENNFKPAK